MLQIIAAPAVDLCIFIGANRDFLFLSLSLSFSLSFSFPFPLSPRSNRWSRSLHARWRSPRNENRNGERNRTLRYISSPGFNGASIKRPREFEARAARPLFYEHVDSCLYRISDSYRGGVRVRSKKECLETMRGGKHTSFYLLFNRSRRERDLSSKSNHFE